MESYQPIELAYITYEPASGADESLAPIIYLHGMTSSKENFQDLAQTVADVTKRKSYAVDARNHGDSEWSDHFNFDVNVDDLLHFMESHGIKKAILVGHSMGGMTAMRTALKRPDRVESIIVEDMLVDKLPEIVINYVAGLMKLMKKTIDAVPEGLDEEATRKFIFEMFLANVPPEVAQNLKERFKGMKSGGMEYLVLKQDANGRFTLKCNIDVLVKAISDPETIVSEAKGVFDGPALHIYGTQSFIKVGDHIDDIKRFFPNAVFEAVDADHSIRLEKPSEFKELFLKFLTR